MSYLIQGIAKEKENLGRLFEKFCEYFGGKLRWTALSSKEWTNEILTFFLELNKLEPKPFEGKKEYMDIDYIWRDDSYCIRLAVEHENYPAVDEFLDSEIQHLIDIKADLKIAITYPSGGDEMEIIEKIKSRIKKSSDGLGVYSTNENYLVIFGFSTRKTIEGQSKPAILFKGYFLDYKGEPFPLMAKKEKVILQAS